MRCGNSRQTHSGYRHGCKPGVHGLQDSTGLDTLHVRREGERRVRSILVSSDWLSPCGAGVWSVSCRRAHLARREESRFDTVCGTPTVVDDARVVPWPRRVTQSSVTSGWNRVTVRLPGGPRRSIDHNHPTTRNPTSPGPWVRATTIWRTSHEIPTR